MVEPRPADVGRWVASIVLALLFGFLITWKSAWIGPQQRLLCAAHNAFWLLLGPCLWAGLGWLRRGRIGNVADAFPAMVASIGALWLLFALQAPPQPHPQEEVFFRHAPSGLRLRFPGGTELQDGEEPGILKSARLPDGGRVDVGVEDWPEGGTPDCGYGMLDHFEKMRSAMGGRPAPWAGKGRLTHIGDHWFACGKTAPPPGHPLSGLGLRQMCFTAACGRLYRLMGATMPPERLSEMDRSLDRFLLYLEVDGCSDRALSGGRGPGKVDLDT